MIFAHSKYNYHKIYIHSLPLYFILNIQNIIFIIIREITKIYLLIYPLKVNFIKNILILKDF